MEQKMMNYNTERSPLQFTEYGRIIQEYVQYLITIDDRDKRNKAARQVIEMMTQINPQFKNLEEYKQKLWDHLHVMSNFKLDVDGPYPVPDKTVGLYIKPDPLPYPKSKLKNKTFGKHISRFIDKSKTETDPDKLKGFSETAAYYMKLAYLNWNNESVTDDSIKTVLKEMSDGHLSIDEDFNLDNVKGGGAYQQNYIGPKKSKNKGKFQQRNFKSNNGGGRKFFKKK